MESGAHIFSVKEKENTMPGNRCVVYVEPGEVSLETIDYPKLELRGPDIFTPQNPR
jgi:hypothetical protein